MKFCEETYLDTEVAKLAGEGLGVASASVPSKIPPEMKKHKAMLQRANLSARAFRSWAAARSIVGCLFSLQPSKVLVTEFCGAVEGQVALSLMREL